MATLLWVEDQSHWIDKFKPILEKADFGDGSSDNDVQVFKFAEAACQHIHLAKQAPDIAILDANMRGNDHAGFAVSRALHKKWPELPVIYLSEHSGTGIEEQAFEQSIAQDFIAKHQSNIEAVLCWRIKAVLRQRTVKADNSREASGEILRKGPLSIDLVTWNVYWHGQKLMNPANPQRPLAPTPRKILRALVESSPRPVTTLQMAEHLDSDNFTYANYRQHIKTLRHSFEQASISAGQTGFIDQCKAGKGIATFGDEGAYCWIPL
ncbi:histidine kinase [Hahella sp. CCB-MM4]|uniref:response regulator transcription factor n=1 Tax=Hahella sp. (strain CCB-MM4) TaxID=1926491 RepID=UPI000B9B2094|nr:response regulator [Hahella sp. CCB-MM4]OZG72957.1 histidine kinase [Hahella sp. CCB-MM4]